MQETSEVAVLEGREDIVDVAIVLNSSGSYSKCNWTVGKLLCFLDLFVGLGRWKIITKWRGFGKMIDGFDRANVAGE